MTDDHKTLNRDTRCRLRRRTLLAGGCAAAGAAIGIPWVHSLSQQSTGVFVAAGQKYDGRLEETIRDGLIASGFDASWVRRRRVLLKPNMVEPQRSVPHMTTHPSVILATAEVFRRWGAQVTVGEAPGHIRDTEMALVESGVEEALQQAGLQFADLNYEDVAWVENRGNVSPLKGFFFPRSVVEADLVVSLPKLKTHHWVGMTGSLKNLYGTLPGIKYGWPKNVLHHAGIPETVFDINASLPKSIAVVDGITCMEGDGPIMGTAKHMGLILVGTNPTAVDATQARIMQLDPAKISYLRFAAGHLGPLAASHIEQRGERWELLAEPFQMLDYPHLTRLKGEMVS
jgi:uncharacterized protein (DUF362 family)